MKSIRVIIPKGGSSMTVVNSNFAQMGFYCNTTRGDSFPREFGLINVEPGNIVLYDYYSSLEAKFQGGRGNSRKGNYNQTALTWLHQRYLSLLQESTYNPNIRLFLEVTEWKSYDSRYFRCLARGNYRVESLEFGFVTLVMPVEEISRGDYYKLKGLGGGYWHHIQAGQSY
jgi:hypothetical protein